jgi:phosphonate transport system substrate-binding protein
LGTDVDLRFDASRSGPRPGEDEPFTRGQVDIAFLCATSYVWLTAPAHPAIELVGAAWAPTDPRADGRAEYFGDVLFPAVAAARHLELTGTPADLAALVGRRVAYNDDVSLSGFHSLRLALAGAGIDPGRVELIRSGSHLRSLAMLGEGTVDAASIDSTVWRRRQREQPRLARELVAVAALGPHPVQPVIARRGLPREVREQVRVALLDAHRHPRVAAALADAELRRFVPVSDLDYAPLRSQMSMLGLTGGATV